MKSHQKKITKEVKIPEIISVQELAKRMAEKSSDVMKALMKNGVMVTINQNIDADTAEIIAGEFGHKVKIVVEFELEVDLKKKEVDDKKDGNIIKLQNFRYNALKEELKSNGKIEILDNENNILDI